MLAAKLVAAVIAGDAQTSAVLSMDDVKVLAANHPSRTAWTGASPEEAAMADSWLEVAFKQVGSAEAAAKVARDMDALLAKQAFLASRAGETVADVAMYGALAPYLAALVEKHANVSRWASQMQQSVGARTGAPSLLSINLGTVKALAALAAVDPRPNADAKRTNAPAAPAAVSSNVEPATPAKDKKQPADAKPAAKPAAKPDADAAAAANATAKPEEAKRKQDAAGAAETDKPAKPAKAPKKEDDSKKPQAEASEQLVATQLDIRVGKVLTCVKHPEADQLYVETIDLGEDQPRTICSGLVAFYPDPAAIIGRSVAVVCNLKPRPLKGVESNGMVLAASDAGKTVVKLVEAVGAPGERVKFGGKTGEAAQPQVVNKKKILETVLAGLGTDADGKVVFKDDKGAAHAMETHAGACTGGGLANAHVG